MLSAHSRNDGPENESAVPTRKPTGACITCHYQKGKKNKIPTQEELKHHRQTWLDAIAAAPHGRIQVAQDSAGLQSQRWLFYHDRAWLDGQRKLLKPYKRTPQIPPIDWLSRDNEIAVLIPKTATKLKEDFAPPVRVTRTKLRRELSKLGFRLSYRKLPQTNKAIQDNVETQRQYSIRRIHWAAKTLSSNGQLPTRSELIRVAAIGKVLILNHEVNSVLDQVSKQALTNTSAPQK